MCKSCGNMKAKHKGKALKKVKEKFEKGSSSFYSTNAQKNRE